MWAASLRRDALPADAAQALSAEAIEGAAAKLGLQLELEQSRGLARYAALLLRWNAVHNLTAIESPPQVLTHHLLDSLAIVPVIKRLTAGRPARVLDVGAGGGLPGVPLAIAAPNLCVTLVDKVQKKVTFLSQVKLELGLGNIEAVHARVETLQTAAFDVIVARAFASLLQLLRSTRHLLAPGGRWCAMKGALPRAELDELNRLMPDVEVDDVTQLRIPHLHAERHLILIKARAQ